MAGVDPPTKVFPSNPGGGGEGVLLATTNEWDGPTFSIQSAENFGKK